MAWYRAYPGMAADPKFAVIAAKVGCSRGDVLQVWVRTLEHMADRGDLTAFKADEEAVTLGLTEPTVTAIMAAFDDRDLIKGVAPTAWNRRQYKSDSSTERSQRSRDNKKQQANGGATDVQRPTTVAATPVQQDATPPDTDSDSEPEVISEIPLTPLEELNGRTEPSAPPPSAGPTFLDLIAIWPRKDAGPDDVRLEWDAAEAQGAKPADILAAARKYLALPEVRDTEPKWLTKLDKWLRGGGWRGITATIEAGMAEARQVREQAWCAKFVAEAKRFPAMMFPVSIREELGPTFNGMQTYGPTELIAEYEQRNIAVPVWLDPLRLPDNLRKRA